ncbi:hypothetical protein [Ruegeria sp. Ofav3-42]|uniref:hypothetical protein n=1 Tax=Ruegeria sp. Ofav3-42 TaxID=2917759 RepID=UPI001EF7027E|nr:hypothetical protein [Ruegeria sp. Ofav3-42]MCG7518617.1 hypothetical protein [Ruegeria sp. Ofav3-42]
MSKADHILASNTRSARSQRRSGFLGLRGRIALLALTTLLMLFVFFTQPHVRATVESWISLITG